MRDLFVDRFIWESFLHYAGQTVLQDQSINAAYHYDTVKDNQQSSHWSSQPESSVKYNQRNREQSQPNVGAQPTLHRPNRPDDNFFPQSEQTGKNKNGE